MLHRGYNACQSRSRNILVRGRSIEISSLRQLKQLQQYSDLVKSQAILKLAENYNADLSTYPTALLGVVSQQLRS